MPSEIARTLHVDIETVKTWCYVFSEYLSQGANPPKGISRVFTLDDLRIFAYISTLWEDDPDIPNIKMGLNGGNHHEEVFDDLIAQATPIFKDISGMRDGENSGMIFIPCSEYADMYQLACSYKLAGDMLIENAHTNNQSSELIAPILYCYRHSLELYLKATKSDRKGGHSIDVLLRAFKRMMSDKFSASTPDWFDNALKVFHDFDPMGTSFRYGSVEYQEIYIELNHLKK